MVLEKYRAGGYIRQDGYDSYRPSLINLGWTWSDRKTNALLSEANLRLGELNAFSSYVPDIDLFIRMHVLKESTTSSRIEGTRTAMEEAIRKKTDVDPEKRDDWQEVQNYVRAMNHSIRRLRDVPLSTRSLREAHGLLMAGVRGRTKLPGEYRRSQNWIGGATINDAEFVPPHHSELSSLMGDLEGFLHNRRIDVPDLMRIAMAHYQFETIHPFLDGNGRIGRLLITLFLVSKNILVKPTLYLSAYFEKHKQAYYDHLMKVRTSNDIIPWIRFFLGAVRDTAVEVAMTLKRVLELKAQIEGTRLPGLGRKLPIAMNLLNHLYKTPSVTAADVENALHVTLKTANLLIGDFVRLGILREITGYRRNRVFIFSKYLELFRG